MTLNPIKEKKEKEGKRIFELQSLSERIFRLAECLLSNNEVTQRQDRTSNPTEAADQSATSNKRVNNFGHVPLAGIVTMAAP